MIRYLCIITTCIIFTAAISLLLLPHGNGVDFISELKRGSDPTWYRNFGGRTKPQIQDDDIFFSNIGSSVASAKRADIVLLGSSFMAYAIDRDTLNTANELEGRSVYNMAFVGIRSGEFSRRIITRWGIKPALWVINADDQLGHFFTNDLSVILGPNNKYDNGAVNRDIPGAYLAVIGRNIRWYIEDRLAEFQGVPLTQNLYRNVKNGDAGFDDVPSYRVAGHSSMVFLRDQYSCKPQPEVIEYAKRFVRQVGGEIILTVIPHNYSCFGQAKELARIIGADFVAPADPDGYTSIDSGGHLDKNGARKFTRLLVKEMVETAAFKRAFGRPEANLEKP